MKNIILTAFVEMCLILSLSSMGVADQSPNPRLITVHGSAELKIDPDQVTFNLGITSLDKIAKNANAQNDSITDKIILAAKRFGIAAEDIKVSQLNVIPVYEESWSKKGFKGYEVQKNITLILKDISHYDSLLNELLIPDRISIYNVNFSLINSREYKDRARLMAIEAAQQKGLMMCAKLGMTIGKPYLVVEESDNIFDPYSQHWFGGGYAPNPFNASNVAPSQSQADSPEIVAGKISVSAKVTISFEIE